MGGSHQGSWHNHRLKIDGVPALGFEVRFVSGNKVRFFNMNLPRRVNLSGGIATLIIAILAGLTLNFLYSQGTLH
jgi:hypothetical protein